jgi:cytochrome bd ubiquinol oxidase subunit II
MHAITSFLAPYNTTIWYVLVGVLFMGYSVLDGFDLGVGALYLLINKDQDRRIFLNAIGPVWDGNEVWLVVGGGAIFAAFPNFYATVFSGFYIPFMLLLFGLIGRAVAIEFRSKEPSKMWRQSWDVVFSLGSIISGFVLGVALGNITRGVPLDTHGEFAGTLLGLFNPYSILLGITVVVLFAMHGAIYLVIKTEGELQERVKSWVPKLITLFIILYGSFNLMTLSSAPTMASLILSRPHVFVTFGLDLLALWAVLYFVKQGKEYHAFISSCLVMVFMLATFGFSYYPNLLISSPTPENSLTIFNSCSTNYTLSLLCIIVAIGMPIVAAYTISVYWIFRGKTTLHDTSY